MFLYWSPYLLTYFLFNTKYKLYVFQQHPAAEFAGFVPFMEPLPPLQTLAYSSDTHLTLSLLGSHPKTPNFPHITIKITDIRHSFSAAPGRRPFLIAHSIWLSPISPISTIYLTSALLISTFFRCSFYLQKPPWVHSEWHYFKGHNNKYHKNDMISETAISTLNLTTHQVAILWWWKVNQLKWCYFISNCSNSII